MAAADQKRARGYRPVASTHHTQGNYTAFLEFTDGTPATLVFNGYGGFGMTELTWGIGEGGYQARDDPLKRLQSRVR